MMNRAFVRGGWQRRVSFFFYPLLCVEKRIGTRVPKLVDASCEIHTMNITVDIYFIYCTYFRYFFKILAKTQPILDEIFQ